MRTRLGDIVQDPSLQMYMQVQLHPVKLVNQEDCSINQQIQFQTGLGLLEER